MSVSNYLPNYVYMNLKGESSSTVEAVEYIHLAKQSLCLCPPDSSTPLSPTLDRYIDVYKIDNEFRQR